MIDLLIAAGTSLAQPPSVQPPGFDLFVCTPQSTDPRCRSAPPAHVTPPVIANMACPDGTIVAAGQQCPVPMPSAPMIVYFGWDDVTLSATARTTLDDTIAAYRRTGDALVLAGHTDRAGAAAYNQALSARYAGSVRDYLIANGVPAGNIIVQAFGETRPAIDTPDGVREPRNRRVEITWAPTASAW